jgi:hypothetical protein
MSDKVFIAKVRSFFEHVLYSKWLDGMVPSASSELMTLAQLVNKFSENVYFWTVTDCTLNTTLAGFSEGLIHFYQIALRHVITHRPENFISYKKSSVI